MQSVRTGVSGVVAWWSLRAASQSISDSWPALTVLNTLSKSVGLGSPWYDSVRDLGR